jgi:hypothetical protein
VKEDSSFTYEQLTACSHGTPSTVSVCKSVNLTEPDQLFQEPGKSLAKGTYSVSIAEVHE